MTNIKCSLNIILKSRSQRHTFIEISVVKGLDKVSSLHMRRRCGEDIKLNVKVYCLLKL